MARARAVEEKRRKPKRKSLKTIDEEISEDDAFNEEDEAKYGRFFQAKKQKPSEDMGELWSCLFESSPKEDSPHEDSNHVKEEQEPSDKHEGRHRAEEDIDAGFTRVEEDEDLFTEDVVDGNADGFKWISDADDGDTKYAGLINKFREIQNDIPDVFKEEYRSKISRDERKELYEQVKKDASKRWEPILHHIKQKKHMVYGEQSERTDPTCGSLTQLEAETPLEKDLEAEANLAYERALHAREVRKQKRINRIKSKKWHKRQKKRDLELYAKLIEKSNDPELTKELLESFEQKRSNHRILRKRNAQQKWAKLAMRFGDRSVLKQIASEQQKLKDDLAFIKDTIDGVKEREGSESEESAAESTSDSEDCRDDPNDEVLQKLNIIANPQDVVVPKKGLFALKFMKDMLQQKIEGKDHESANQATQDSTKDHLDDYDGEDSSNDVDSDVESPADSAIMTKARPATPSVSDAELKIAMRQIQAAFGVLENEEDHSSHVATCEVGVDVDNTKAGHTNVSKQTVSDIPGLEGDSKRAPDTKIVDAVKPKQGQATNLANLLDEADELDTFIKNLGPAKKPEGTVEVAKRLFVTKPDEEAYLSGDETEEEDITSDKLKGWGSWTGFGIVETKKNKEEPVNQVKKKSTIKVSKKKDPKLAKYLLHRVPHPYKNKDDYNAKMATSIGAEWNTSKMHAQLVQPKTVIKVGSVVKPLSIESAKGYVKRMGKAFNRNRTHARL
ncbi:hypothetical protein X943_002189 [Babesia divergens]|uniref:U3 small nucleolar RNA-associated protein 14 n=1 Tax=Babesia divergens TaxID=32595 RepID=A0AAD9GD51_BABDI|nr:hypothetical protein X943_002189 [Babesia divergens]